MAAAASARTSPRRSRPEAATVPARRQSLPAPPHRAPRPQPVRPRGAPATRATLRFVESRLLDRLLRGRLWVGCIGGLLAGIVFLNVTLLELNQEIARTSAKAGAIDRQNADLRMKLAGLDSTHRVARIAARRGMVFPQAGDYRYLGARPGDGLLAARRVTTPRPSTTAAGAPATVQPTAAQPSASPGGATLAYRAPAATATRTGAPSAAAGSTSPPTAAAPAAPHP